MRTYIIKVRERDGQLWIQIPRPVIRHLGLKPGDTVYWRKVRGENAYFLTFKRRGDRSVHKSQRPRPERASIPTRTFGYFAVKADDPMVTLANTAASPAPRLLTPAEFVKLTAKMCAGKSPKSAERLRVKLMEVFSNNSAVQKWMTTPLKMFAGKSPLEMASTAAGAAEVEQALGRLEHGVFS